MSFLFHHCILVQQTWQQRANTNKHLAHDVQDALDKDIRYVGIVSVVITCPYSSNVDNKYVRDATKELDMGC